MQQSFVCPDCHSVHVEPAEAAYILAVRCCECDLAACWLDEQDNFLLVAAAA